MAQPLRCVPANSVITGWDFSTGAVKCLAFTPAGNTVAEVRFPTDLHKDHGVSELNLMLLEGQVRATTRAIAAALRERQLLSQWIAGGISATHHTAGRIDRLGNQIRRAICWNDFTLAEYHRIGLERLGGQAKVKERIHGPWASRYSLSHLVKDEALLPRNDWERTYKILSHGSLAAGYLTGRFDVSSISSAASTGIMDLAANTWCIAMLDALETREYRSLAAHQLPTIITDMCAPLGPVAEHLALEAGIPLAHRPLIFPTSDDQAAGLVGGGAVDPGQVAVILGNSAVVNSSSRQFPAVNSALDCMKLNWGPYLWMRCYNNGAQFLDRVVGCQPDWAALEAAARNVPPGCDGFQVLPFVNPEPSRGIHREWFQWHPQEPAAAGIRFRASLEALAYLIKLGVAEHVDAGQSITRVTVSGGIARSDLMCEILATVLALPLERLVSNEGPALGAAVTALAAVEGHRRRQQGLTDEFHMADAVAAMVQFRAPVAPNMGWRSAYEAGMQTFAHRVELAAASR